MDPIVRARRVRAIVEAIEDYDYGLGLKLASARDIEKLAIVKVRLAIDRSARVAASAGPPSSPRPPLLRISVRGQHRCIALAACSGCGSPTTRPR